MDNKTETELRSEIERLRAELERAGARIADLELRVDSDPLTGLRNRTGFERDMKRALSYIERYGGCAALVFFDLDDFKAINDRHGHAAGDAVLRGVADILSGTMRASDVVARIGGDEFAAVIWNIELPAALAKAAQLEAFVMNEAINYAPPGGEPIPLRIGMSCGVAALEANASHSHVLEAADRAMYARKLARANERAARRA
jgi:diguanylate cyclase (GGDEF)-like protein